MPVADHIVAWQAMKCRGDSLNWLAATPALIPMHVEPSHELPLIAWLGTPRPRLLRAQSARSSLSTSRTGVALPTVPLAASAPGGNATASIFNGRLCSCVGSCLRSRSGRRWFPCRCSLTVRRFKSRETTKRLPLDGCSARNLTQGALHRPTAVYVIPLLETGGVWYARPNDQPSATLPGLPEYLSGPGIAYGYDQVDGGPRAFANGQHFELNLIDGLQWWNGSAFVDPGLEQIEAFRSSGSPAITSDSLTPASPATLAYSNVSASYNATAHSSASFRLLGDGAAPLLQAATVSIC